MGGLVHTEESVDVVTRLDARRIGAKDKADSPVHEAEIDIGIGLGEAPCKQLSWKSLTVRQS